MSELILFAVSALPVILLGRYVYKLDKNKEPNRLLLKLFVGGILSCFLVLIISSILGSIIPLISADATKLNLYELIIHVFVGIALVEEFSKWVFVYTMSYNDRDFDELYDMIVYAVFVALGFAFFENLIYVYQGGIGNGLIRAILAVPGHACDGVLMGYYLGLAKLGSLNGRKDLRNKYLFLSILGPTITHGIYDYCLFSGQILFFIIFIIFVITVYIITYKRIKRISKIDKKMIYKDNYCPNCGTIVNSNICPRCGRKNE